MGIRWIRVFENDGNKYLDEDNKEPERIEKSCCGGQKSLYSIVDHVWRKRLLTRISDGS